MIGSPKLDGMSALIAFSIGWLIVSEAHARDGGQFTDAPEQIKAWFKGLKSPKGTVPCCDEADGHLTNYLVRDGKYWVSIEGQWYEISPESVVRNSGNPTGEGVIFYYLMSDHENGGKRPVIFCFVPDDTN